MSNCNTLKKVQQAIDDGVDIDIAIPMDMRYMSIECRKELCMMYIKYGSNEDRKEICRKVIELC